MHSIDGFVQQIELETLNLIEQVARGDCCKWKLFKDTTEKINFYYIYNQKKIKELLELEKLVVKQFYSLGIWVIAKWLHTIFE